MWIKFKETYSGPLRVYVKDSRIDMDKDSVELLPKDCWKKTTPPWEDHTDRAALDKAAADAAISKANHHLSNLQDKADEAAENYATLQKVLENKQAEAENAHAEGLNIFKLAEVAAKKLENTATPKNKKQKTAYKTLQEQVISLESKVEATRRDFDRKSIAARRAEGELMIASTVEDVADLDLQAAESVLSALEEEADAKTKKKPKAKTVKQAAAPKDETPAKTEEAENDKDDSTEPAVKPAEAEDNKSDDQLTEGPAVETEPKTE